MAHRTWRTLLATVIVVLLAVPAFAAGKKCPKLCRAETRACWAECARDRASNRERLKCKRGCVSILSRCRAARDVATCLPPG
jgi:hypothetical protein